MDQDFLDRQYTEKEIFRLPEGSGDPGPAVVVGLVHHTLPRANRVANRQ